MNRHLPKPLSDGKSIRRRHGPAVVPFDTRHQLRRKAHEAWLPEYPEEDQGEDVNCARRKHHDARNPREPGVTVQVRPDVQAGDAKNRQQELRPNGDGREKRVAPVESRLIADERPAIEYHYHDIQNCERDRAKADQVIERFLDGRRRVAQSFRAHHPEDQSEDSEQRHKNPVRPLLSAIVEQVQQLDMLGGKSRAYVSRIGRDQADQRRDEKQQSRADQRRVVRMARISSRRWLHEGSLNASQELRRPAPHASRPQPTSARIFFTASAS